MNDTSNDTATSSPTPAKEWEFHPLANIFPMMSDDELAELAHDIKMNGQQLPIFTLDDLIVDGRNRYRACKIAGVPPDMRPLTSAALTSASATAFVLSLNKYRRHLTQSQKAMIAAAAKPFFEAEAKARELAGTPTASGQQGTAAKAAAKATGSSERSVFRAQVVREADPALAKQVLNGETSLNAAHKQVLNKIVAERQTEVLARRDFIHGKQDEAKRLREIAREIHDLGKELATISKTPIGAYLHAQSFEAGVERVKSAIKFAIPYAICPYCGGDTCQNCRKSGWMPQDIYDRVPQDIKTVNATAKGTK